MKAILRIAVALLLLVPVHIARAQHEDWKRGVKAEAVWSVGNSETMEQARRNALYEAQLAALRNAGVATDIRSGSFSFISNTAELGEVDEFSQISSFYLGGLVKLTEEPEYENFTEHDVHKVRVRIVADVKKEEKRDAEFAIDVKGLQTTYRAGELLAFSVRASKSSYVRVFLFDDLTNGTGQLIYPIDGIDDDVPLLAKQSYQFPRSGMIDYTLTSAAERETNYLVVVATKQQIPFMKDVSFSTFFDWYHSIKSYDKTEFSLWGFTILK